MICNEQGKASKSCSDATGKLMLAGAFNGYIINACTECTDWYSANVVCAFPQ